MSRKTDKRVRLIEAAKDLIHQQSFNLTTLADIAYKAVVPLGNVYYYFKKKEEIGEAVIDKLSATYSELLRNINQVITPVERLKAFIKHTISEDNLEQVARYGCEIGGLCQELSKQSGPLADKSAKLLYDLMDWTESQFKGMGCGAESANFALIFVSGIQGSYLLTNTFKDPKFSILQAEILSKWIDGISGKLARTGGITSKEAEEALV